MKEIAAEFGINSVAQLPIIPGLAEICDNGEIESFEAEKFLAPVINSLCNA